MGVHFSKLAPDTVIFSHHDDDTGAQTHFAVSLILSWIKETKPEPWQVPIETQAAEMIRACRGLEQHRLNPLLAVENPDPVIFVHMPDDTHLLIDGSHRYVAMHAQGKQWISAYIFEFCEITPFLIEGIPTMPKEAVNAGYSGL